MKKNDQLNNEAAAEEAPIQAAKLSRSSCISPVYDAFARHPFILALLACLILTPLCFGSQGNMRDSAKMIWCLIGISIPAASVIYLCRRNKLRRTVQNCLMVITCAVGIVLSGFFTRSEKPALWIFAYTVIIAAALRLLMLGEKTDKDRHNAMMIMLISFGMKFCYVLYTSCYTRQNDVGSFDTERGHASYIEYLIQNLHLPDFKPTSRWQYYHPPFHHTISAVWINLLENVFGVSRNAARESLQMLTLFYSAAAAILVYKILRHFGFSGKALIFPLALFAFHPAYILSAGAINNDQLANLLVVVTIFLTLRWAKEPTLRRIIPIAFSIGLAMMTKLNSALIAPAVAVIFLWQLAKNLDKIKKLMLQYVVFGAICIPLGLWWSVRNMIKWNMEWDYIPNLGEGTQFVGDDIFRRLTDFSSKQFYPVFENWKRDGSAFDEYNPNVAIAKNSLFGESISSKHFPGAWEIIPTVLFWLALVLALLGVGVMIWMIFRKDTRPELHDKLFLAGFWAFSMYYFYLFCYLYPNTCTQNFRYIYHLLAVSAVQYAMLYDVLEGGEATAAKKWLSRILSGAIILFAALSCGTYLIVGFL